MSRSAYPTKHKFRHDYNGMAVTKLGQSVILILCYVHHLKSICVMNIWVTTETFVLYRSGHDYENQ